VQRFERGSTEQAVGSCVMKWGSEEGVTAFPDPSLDDTLSASTAMVHGDAS